MSGGVVSAYILSCFLGRLQCMTFELPVTIVDITAIHGQNVACNNCISLPLMDSVSISLQ